MNQLTQFRHVRLAAGLALAVAGAAAITYARGTPSPLVAAPAPIVAQSPGAANGGTNSGTAPATNSDAERAVMAVVQQANDEQRQALAQHDPTLMRDTATSSYYNELVQIQQDLESGGVTSIALVGLEWGPVGVQGNSAQATTYETWRTTFADGTTEQDRAQNNYTLVQQDGAWKIQSDDQPPASPSTISTGPGGRTAPTSPSTGGSGGAGATAPSTANPAPGVPGANSSSMDTSRNWSGYAATGGTFTAVSGTWTVPEVATTTSGGDATWVGIGGIDSNDLIQAGTDAMVLGSGQVRYQAWIETLPQASRTVALPVSPGDTVSVTLAEQSAGRWVITMDNYTTGQEYQTAVSYSSSRSSAEWIEEAPVVGRRLAPLDDFDTVLFRAGSAVENGQTVSIAQSGARPITMIDGTRQPIAQASALGEDGGSFSVSSSTAASSLA